jgi:hypothetical protein
LRTITSVELCGFRVARCITATAVTRVSLRHILPMILQLYRYNMGKCTIQIANQKKEQVVNIYFYDPHQSVSYKNSQNSQSGNTKLRLVHRHATGRCHHTELVLQVLCDRCLADDILLPETAYHATVTIINHH